MIPLAEPNQTIFTLSNPESYGEADLFVFEIPDYYHVSHNDFGLYLLLDMSTQYKATVMLQTDEFYQMRDFVNTHDKLFSTVEIKYTFQCETLST